MNSKDNNTNDLMDISQIYHLINDGYSEELVKILKQEPAKEFDLNKKQQIENLELYSELNIKMKNLIDDFSLIDNLEYQNNKIDIFSDKIDELRQYVHDIFAENFEDSKLYFQLEAIDKSLDVFNDNFINREDLLSLNIEINEDGLLTVSDIDGKVLSDGINIYNEEKSDFFDRFEIKGDSELTL